MTTAPDVAPDVVYVLGPGAGEELRYSLRSLRNVPHGRVWIAGVKPPPWVQGVEHIPVLQQRNRYVSTTANLQAACEHPEVSAEFLLFNDDFYVMQPVDQIPLMHRGPIGELAHRLRWADASFVRGMRSARELCRQMGVADPLSYEAHVPMLVRKGAMSTVLDRLFALPELHSQKRTLYGNLVFDLTGEPGEQILDPKVSGPKASFDPAATYLSTSRWYPTSPVARHIAATFPEPSPYEQGVARVC